MKAAAIPFALFFFLILYFDVEAQSTRKLLKVMTGSFNSQLQSEKDSSYYNISLHMYPIWKSNKEDWLYVEQALISMQDKPYRQRVYKLELLDDGTYASHVYLINEPDKFIGKWNEPAFFGQFDKSDLTKREGCTVFMKKEENGMYVGATRGQDCKSNLRGASYATSKVTISKNKIESWDQGFNTNNEQVWGAEKGGYVFIKQK